MTDYMEEKTSLLPLNQEEECPRFDCQTNKLYKKRFRRQSFFFVLFAILFALYNGYQKNLYEKIPGRHHQPSNSEVAISSYQSVQYVTKFDDDIVLYNEDQMDVHTLYSASSNSCSGKPDIAFSGLSKFEFSANKYPKLLIEQKTNNRNGRSISTESGEANVYVDESVSQATVEFDIKFSREDFQDIFWIEETHDEETGIYSLIIKAGETHAVGCVSIDVTVRVPRADDLNIFRLSLANSGITLHEGLSFKDTVHVSVANGFIAFPDGISAGEAGFDIANGYTSGTINTLNNKLLVSIANGYSSIAIKEIDPSETQSVPIKISIANGHVDLAVPSAFESSFELKSVIGRHVIESDHPEKIHRSTGGWGVTRGYYGDHSGTGNYILLEGTNGNLKLSYL